MRAGTQTLIQALQALPWMNPDNDDESNALSPMDIGSDDEDQRQQFQQLSSSIHTIHRPLARSRRISIPGLPKHGIQAHSAVIEEELAIDDTVVSDEEIEQDFEDTSHSSTSRPSLLSHQSIPPSTPVETHDSILFKSMMTRTGSMATVKLHRRARLAEKLRDIYELDDIQEVCAEMPCWLLRSVLLQGYMYLTNSHLCFFAHMPTREDQILKSGSLNKKAQRTKRWIKHWFVLKNDALSWYQSSSDPYFPHGIVDLRYAISCDAVGGKDFRLRTNQKTVILSADSVPSQEEWVKAIRKVIFKAQNMGDSVKIAIPYSVVLDVERSSAMDFSETIEVKVVDKGEQEHYSVDSYFFAYFQDLSGSLEQIRDVIRSHRSFPEQETYPALLDTTVSRSSPISLQPSTNPLDISIPKAVSGFRLSSLLKPLSDTLSLGRSGSNILPETQGDDYTHIYRRGNSSFIPVTTSPKSTSQDNIESRQDPSRSSVQSLPPLNHTYPPSTSRASTYPNESSLSRDSTNSWNVGVPSWFKSRRVFGALAGNNQDSPFDSAGVKEVYSAATVSSPGPINRSGGTGDMAFSVLETPDIAADQEATDKFRAAFAYDEKEILLGYFPGYIYRLLPVSGRLYVSTNFFCFKSSGPLTSRTRMTLPLRDILALEKSKATRFGHHGLIIIVKGHEELFFEFGAEDKRAAFVQLLENQMESVRKRMVAGTSAATTSPGKRDALTLEAFETRSIGSDCDPSPPPENMADSLPALMFTSASSTFLNFKPHKSLRFTFLTIGSRGDVQPYIALAKGLIADGHKCKIATHGEFQAWIESHGIEYGYVGGDPAELMRICVENGTFTVSFLKEGLQKFRGWLDDLLKTSWEACQGADVLVESPSAMGGYHIAEALAIPYFRAFTMTWTRTRAYPHAFAVPERKMGGSYNYMTYVMFDQVFWRATAGQINRWRRDLLHLGPTSLDKMEPHKIPFLYNFSPHVVPPPLDWPEWIRVTGYWFLDDADVSSKKWTPPQDLIDFIDNAHQSRQKVVYIGFGSIVVSDPKTMTRCVVEAVLQSGVRAILSKGWSDRLHVKSGDDVESEEALPAEIYPISSVPHDWLFQRIDAACHHGGAGTTGASLRAGIPTIIRPFFGDQMFWADRVEALGVGTGVRKLTVQSLTEALVLATTDQKQIDRAKAIGEQIRGEKGVSTAIESIYRDLEYARSLIKRQRNEESDGEAETDLSTIRDHDHRVSYSPESYSGYNSSGSVRGAPSEEWSVISDQDDRRSSIGSRRNNKDKRSSQRRSLSTSP